WRAYHATRGRLRPPTAAPQGLCSPLNFPRSPRRSLRLPHRLELALLEQGKLLLGKLAVILLPFRRLSDTHYLHRGHFVFRAVGGPVRVVGGNNVGARLREVERRVDDTRRDTLRHGRPQYGLTGAADDTYPVVFLDASDLRIVRVYLDAVLAMPRDVGG